MNYNCFECFYVSFETVILITIIALAYCHRQQNKKKQFGTHKPMMTKNITSTSELLNIASTNTNSTPDGVEMQQTKTVKKLRMTSNETDHKNVVGKETDRGDIFDQTDPQFQRDEDEELFCDQSEPNTAGRNDGENEDKITNGGGFVE